MGIKTITKSVEETKKISRQLLRGSDKGNKKRSNALVFALIGELGSGKTVFSQGLAELLGVKEKVLSPTFIIYRKHRIPKNKFGFSWFYHIDTYRVESEKDLSLLGFEEIVSNPKNIVSIEWADKVKDLLKGENIIWLKFKTVPGRQNYREIFVN